MQVLQRNAVAQRAGVLRKPTQFAVPKHLTRRAHFRTATVTKAGLKEQIKENIDFAAGPNKSRGAYDKDAYAAPGGWPGAFTRQREIWTGRIALLGMFAAVAGELALHQGPIGQMSTWTGQSYPAVLTGFLGLIGVNFIAGLLPGSPTYDPRNQADVQKRPDYPKEGLAKPGTLFDVTDWGFSKKNELLHGRIAMLGFFGTILAEIRTPGSLGPLGQLAWWFNLTPDNTWYNNAAIVLAVWSVLCYAVALFNGNTGQKAGDEDIF